MSAKKVLPLLLLLLVSFALMTYQSRNSIIAPFSFLAKPFNYLNDILHSLSVSAKEPFRKLKLRDEDNRKLMAEVDRLLLEQHNYRDVFLENQRLKDMLALKAREKKYIAAAQIISRGMDTWSKTITIDKGTQDGILKDMAVITPRGLAGKVISADKHHAGILLMNDINFSAGVRFRESRKEAILSGSGSGFCILKYVPHEEAVKAGDILETSGLDGLFPAEVPVGYVSEVSRKTSGIFQDIKVRPFQDLAAFDEVIIIRR